MCKLLKKGKGLKDEICRKVDGVVWKARDGDGSVSSLAIR